MTDIVSYIDDLERETSPRSITPGREAAILRAMLSRVESAEEYVRRMIDSAAGGDLSQAVEDATNALEELKKTVDYRAIISRLDSVESKAAGNAEGIESVQRNLDSEIEGVNESISVLSSKACAVARGVIRIESISDLDEYAFPHLHGWWLVSVDETTPAAVLLVIPSVRENTATQWLFGDIRLGLNYQIKLGTYGVSEMIAFRTRNATGKLSDWKVFDIGRAEQRLSDIEAAIGSVSERVEAFSLSLDKNSTAIRNMDALLHKTSVTANTADAFPISECRAFSRSEIIGDDGSLLLSALDPDTTDPGRRWKYGIGHIDGITTSLEDAILGVPGNSRAWFIYAFSCGMQQTSSGSDISQPSEPLYTCAVVKNFLKSSTKATESPKIYWFVDADGSSKQFRLPSIRRETVFSTPSDIENGSLQVHPASVTLRVFDGSSFSLFSAASSIPPDTDTAQASDDNDAENPAAVSQTGGIEQSPTQTSS